MTEVGGTNISSRRLSDQDAEALAIFSCRRYRQPWTAVVEEMIRELLGSLIAQGYVEGVGLWAADELVGVAAWQVEQDPPGWMKGILVAVANGHQRKGHGRTLKQAMLDRAREMSAVVLVSEVHWKNNAMIELNASLGANVERIPGDQDYCRCVIRI